MGRLFLSFCRLRLRRRRSIHLLRQSSTNGLLLSLLSLFLTLLPTSSSSPMPADVPSTSPSSSSSSSSPMAPSSIQPTVMAGGSDDLAAISAALPEKQRNEFRAHSTAEKFSCTHSRMDFNILRQVLLAALKSGDNKAVDNNTETTTVDKPQIDMTNASFIGPSSHKFWVDSRVVDAFPVPDFGKNSTSFAPEGGESAVVEMLHSWAKMTLPTLPDNSTNSSSSSDPEATYSYHNLMFRLKHSKKVVAVWRGQIFSHPKLDFFQSQWTGTSINLVDPRHVLDVTWHLHSAHGQSCWFGEATSFEQTTSRNLTRWTHLIEYPGNGTWSGFVVIKNMVEKTAPTQFWAGNGNSTADVLAKENWKDYTHIWLGTEEDVSNADRNLSRGWIWTMLTSIFVLCVCLSWLVFWLTRERIDLKFKGRRRSSLMAILARSKHRLRKTSTRSTITTETTTAI